MSLLAVWLFTLSACSTSDSAWGALLEGGPRPTEVDSSARPASPGALVTVMAQHYDRSMRDFVGQVDVWVLVDHRGVPRATEVASSTEPALDSIATRILSDVLFSPATKAGELVPAWTMVPLHFGTAGDRDVTLQQLRDSLR